MNSDTRWRQRFINFENSYTVFVRRYKGFENSPHDEAQQMALIQAFEIVIELSWKTLKDYLEFQGHKQIQTSKQAIRQAFQDGIITKAETWMQALELRNESSHTYQAQIYEKFILFIHKEFFPIVQELYSYLKNNV
jgi:nucleotidyltransferase substrate binding protein (TIGR01987 family)